MHQQAVKLFACPASGVVIAGSKSLVDDVSSSKANEERLTRASLACVDFATIRLSIAASSAVDPRAEH